MKVRNCSALWIWAYKGWAASFVRKGAIRAANVSMEETASIVVIS